MASPQQSGVLLEEFGTAEEGSVGVEANKRGQWSGTVAFDLFVWPWAEIQGPEPPVLRKRSVQIAGLSVEKA